MPKNNPDDLFQDDSTIPESNWFKFDKVGRSIQGLLVTDPYDKDSKLGGMQKVYVLEAAYIDGKKIDAGNEYMVAMKHTSNKRQIQQLRNAEVGDEIAFKFTEEIDTGKGNPAKAIDVRLRKHNVEDKIKQSGI